MGDGAEDAFDKAVDEWCDGDYDEDFDYCTPLRKEDEEYGSDEISAFLCSEEYYERLRKCEIRQGGMTYATPD